MSKIRYATKNFLAKFSKKMQILRLIHQKLNSKDVFRPLVVLHLTKIQFATKNYVANIFIKVHRFRLIHQRLNLNGFFRPLLVTNLLKIKFPTKNFLAKIFIKVHRFRLQMHRLFTKNLIQNIFSDPWGVTFVQNSIFYKKFPIKIYLKNA